MLGRLKRAWHGFRSRKPGTRFVTSYKKHHAEGSSVFARVGFVVLGVVVLAVGIIALPAPGPGMPIVATGLVLLARESLWAARLMDRAELKGRSLMHRVKRRFHRAR
ncbi:MAG TPA: PGPGW domain-containing protein [Gemmatimonadaceae bacterium]|nr:PGPGW domain-containing protein [Gemmatimonadaceae bacterium]